MRTLPPSPRVCSRVGRGLCTYPGAFWMQALQGQEGRGHACRARMDFWGRMCAFAWRKSMRVRVVL